MKIQIFFISCIIFIVIGLSIIQVAVSNNLSTTGIELSHFELDITKYKKENILLRERLLTASSFTTIASKAADMGFVEEKQRIFMTAALPLAIKP